MLIFNNKNNRSNATFKDCKQKMKQMKKAYKSEKKSIPKRYSSATVGGAETKKSIALRKKKSCVTKRNERFLEELGLKLKNQ